ncbi:hypothetical protein HYH03_001078 [Edaphochlamys debaryana]|uniref:Ribosome biogenesis GTPase RsgA n=1 Tax=Edaphochlamys debaryana TaxID=47281 RepID=A0A835YP52_9CHLO|nr:hypothetical protein HYH03_001078 [Edaphochlamys debaryana]|eukprot:KAG2501274.1 hypothetical protein HYH03_001078 [Edaphochlamys debaryana]
MHIALPSPSSPPSPSSTPSASTSPASPSASGEADQASPGPSSSGTDRLDSDAKPNLDLGPDLDPGSGQALAPPRQLLCSVRGLLRKLRQDVVVGDVVRLSSIDWAQGRGVVAEVLPRSSRLTDPAVANVDHVMLVFALANPPFEEIQVSRFLVAAEAAGLPFSLLLNKADLVPPEELQRRLGQCRAWGYEPIVLSCETGRGVEQVAEALQGRVSVVAGPSGAGKSSLINALRLGRHRPDLPPPPPEPELDSPSPAASDCDEDAGNLDLDSDSAATGSGSGSDRVAAAPSDPLELRLPPPGLRRRRRGGGGDPSAASSAGASTDGGGGSSGRATDADGSADPDTEADAEAGPGSGPGSEAEAEGEAAEWLAVGALSRIGRGMHTTTAVRLLRLAGGGWLADTPGFGQPTLDDLPSTSLAACFPDLPSTSLAACFPEFVALTSASACLTRTLASPPPFPPRPPSLPSTSLAACFPEFMALTSASACRFADCLHVAEPGCAVSGQGVERYSHYLRLLQEIKTREASDLKAVQRAKAEREGYAKAKSVRGGGERLEARLDSKKHRRTSRAANKAAGRRGEDL